MRIAALAVYDTTSVENVKFLQIQTQRICRRVLPSPFRYLNVGRTTACNLQHSCTNARSRNDSQSLELDPETRQLYRARPQAVSLGENSEPVKFRGLEPKPQLHHESLVCISLQLPEHVPADIFASVAREIKQIVALFRQLLGCPSASAASRVRPTGLR